MLKSIVEQKINIMKEKGYSVVNISADNTRIIMLKSIQNGIHTSYINAKIDMKNHLDADVELYTNYIDDAIVLRTKAFPLKFGSFDLQESKLKENMKKLNML